MEILLKLDGDDFLCPHPFQRPWAARLRPPNVIYGEHKVSIVTPRASSENHVDDDETNLSTMGWNIFWSILWITCKYGRLWHTNFLALLGMGAWAYVRYSEWQILGIKEIYGKTCWWIGEFEILLIQKGCHPIVLCEALLRTCIHSFCYYYVSLHSGQFLNLERHF